MDRTLVLLSCFTLAAACAAPRPAPAEPASARRPPAPPAPADILEARWIETGAAGADLSTAEMQAIVASGAALVLDARPHLEWAVSHIPGARNLAPKPGTPMSRYVSDVAEVGRLTGGDRARPIVLYCNGPFCGKSKRLAAELAAAGYTSVRRYQLGAPVWRALGNVMVIEPDGVRYVVAGDRTAVLIDARDASEVAAGTVPGARNIPRSRLAGKDAGEIKAAKDDGRLPMHDHNTRVVVFGRDGAQARAVAEAIAGEAFHNVAWFAGSYQQLAQALAERR